MPIRIKFNFIFQLHGITESQEKSTGLADHMDFNRILN